MRACSCCSCIGAPGCCCPSTPADKQAAAFVMAAADCGHRAHCWMVNPAVPQPTQQLSSQPAQTAAPLSPVPAAVAAAAAPLAPSSGGGGGKYMSDPGAPGREGPAGSAPEGAATSPPERPVGPWRPLILTARRLLPVEAGGGRGVKSGNRYLGEAPGMEVQSATQRESSRTHSRHAGALDNLTKSIKIAVDEADCAFASTGPSCSPMR